MSRLNFVEEHNSDQTEPTAKMCAEFDWDEVERAFNESPLSPEDTHKLAFALGVVLDWLLKGNLNHRSALKRIGKRTVALAWVLRPERFGDNASLRSLSKQLGFSAPNISGISAACSKHFKISNQFQVHDWRNKSNEHTNN